MTRNVGGIDRAARAGVALTIMALLMAQLLGGVLAIAGALAATVLLLTAAVGWCPLYQLLGVATHRRNPRVIG
jgi:hypothetical protein